MPFFVTKSLLAFVLLLCGLVAAVSMFELLGRTEKPSSADRLRRVHKIAGVLYALLFAALSGLCISYLVRDHAEPSPRVAFHIVLALSILSLFLLKVSYVRRYRQFYGQVRAIGAAMTVMTFVIVFLSGGYYLAASALGARGLAAPEGARFSGDQPSDAVKTEAASRFAPKPDGVDRGKRLFEDRCAFCHDARSSNAVVGPGLKGLLRHPVLPVSKAPATLENVARQIRQPLGKMPPFDFLSDREMSDLLAYLHTL